jgi:hypothetical protein
MVGVSVDDLIDFTPELRAEAPRSEELPEGPLFTPPRWAIPTAPGTPTLPNNRVGPTARGIA